MKLYKWELVDEPGELMMVEKWKLHVDTDYQREGNGAKILEIASKWSWLAFGALIVARREGKLWVVDGQHRMLAAMKRSDIKTLPCVVFRSKGQSREARGFYDSNSNRKPVSAISKFRALVVAGDETALFVKGILDERGIIVGKESDHPHVLRCIHRAQVLARIDKDAFTEVLDFIVKLCGNTTGIHEQLLGGIYYMHKNCGAGLRDSRLKDRLLTVGVLRLVESATRAAAYFAKGGPKVWAQGFLDAVNKGLRETTRYELGTSPDAQA